MIKIIYIIVFCEAALISHAADLSTLSNYILNLPEKRQIQIKRVINKDNSIFFMSESEITQEQYVNLLNAKIWESIKKNDKSKTWFNETYGNMKIFMKKMSIPKIQEKSLPVHSVSWDEAFAWCEMLNMYIRNNKEAVSPELKEQNFVIRLPTVAEWRTACGEENSNSISRPAQNRSGTPQPVKSTPANALGFYDMLGNVSEWTADAMQPNRLPYWTEPRGFSYHKVASEIKRIHIGGSWKTDIANCKPDLLEARPAARIFVMIPGIEVNRITEKYIQGFKSNEIGFRIVFAAPLQ